MWAALQPESQTAEDRPTFSNLRTLKLRQASLTDASINPILAACPRLQRLDLSFTHVKHIQLGESKQMLEKISLTSTKTPMKDLLAILLKCPKLRILVLGAMGGGQGSSVAISNSTAMTMTDQTLRSVTDILAELPDLERVSLVGNSKLGITASRANSALADFVRRVGRRCKVRAHLNRSVCTGGSLYIAGPKLGQYPRITSFRP